MSCVPTQVMLYVLRVCHKDGDGTMWQAELNSNAYIVCASNAQIPTACHQMADLF